MADCGNQVGVRNIILTFRDCDTDRVYGPISHELSGDDQPRYRLCEYSNEPMPGGYVRRRKGNNQITVTVIRNNDIPLSLYQGCGSVDITIEHFNGMTVTGLTGTATGDDDSDGHEVTLTLTFREVDEILPSAA